MKRSPNWFAAQSKVAMLADAYRTKLIATLPSVHLFLTGATSGWTPTESQLLAAVESGYRFLKSCADTSDWDTKVAQAGKIVQFELNGMQPKRPTQLTPPMEQKEDLSDYFDPMDPGFPDRGSKEVVQAYLQKRKAKGLLSPAAAAKRIATLEHPGGKDALTAQLAEVTRERDQLRQKLAAISQLVNK